MRIGVVLNPVAGGGRMAARWPALAAALEREVGAFELASTTGPGDAAMLAQAMVGRGVDLVIAAGGDGTIGAVVDGLLNAGGEAQLGILPVGTGGDFARSIDIDTTGDAAVRALGSGRTRRIDAGRIEFVADDGRPSGRHFVNIASLGLSGPTDRAVNAVKQRGRAAGQAVFLFHTVRELWRYVPQWVRVVLDDGAKVIEARIAVVAVANGRYFGGGMMIAPDAALGDGWFDVVIFRAASKLRLIADLRLLYGGAHRTHPLVSIDRARRVVVEPLGDPALLDIDGESPGRIPATFEMLPGALTVRG